MRRGCTGSASNRRCGASTLEQWRTTQRPRTPRRMLRPAANCRRCRCLKPKASDRRAAMTAADRVTLREWRRADINAVASYANNRKLWINMRDRLPYPYTCAHARAWIAHCAAQTRPATQFAIDLDGSAVGAIGFERFSDV